MTTLAADTFTRADGALGTAETGGAWTFAKSGTTVFNVSSNKAKLQTAFGTDIAWFDPAVGDVEMSVDIDYLTASNVGLAVRVTPHSSPATVNLILVSATAGSVGLFHCTNGSYTQAGSNAGTLTNGVTYNLKVTVSGNTFNVYLDSVLIIGPQTITQHAGVTKLGMLSFNDVNTRFDNFLLTDIVAADTFTGYPRPQQAVYRM